ncbi:ATPase, partial [Acidobacteria bacterium AH-259-O06]|nr:ATPase [Acidobacteria bacterium AH-259-O06]
HLPVRCVWAATGNNPELSTEILRRSIRIRLDPKHSRPWERKDFKHPRLKEWASKHRSGLIWASLILIQNWIASGCHLYRGRTLGSYESWAAILGGVLVVNGVDGFLDNLDEFYKTTDTESAQWGAFVEKWWEKFSQRTIGVGALLPLAQEGGIVIRGSIERAQAISLGKQITKHRDQVIDQYQIVFAGKVKRASMWMLSPTKASCKPREEDMVGECSE